MLYKFLSIFLIVSFLKFTNAQVVSNSVNTEKRVDSTSLTGSGSIFYINGQFFNAYRSFEDLSSSKSFQSRIDEQPIYTGGIEVGSYISLSDQLYIGIGANYYGGGETWSYIDSLTDSTFSYTNKYRQIGLPLRLNLELGQSLKWFGFVGIIPSSIFGRRYESSYTDTSGTFVENDIEIIQDNINTFQFSGSLGTGVKYCFGTTSVFVMGEYRHHFTNTYTGLFLNHQMKLLGISAGLSYSF